MGNSVEAAMAIYNGSGRVPINDKIRERAKEFLDKTVLPPRGVPLSDATLRQIINGKLKSVDVEWWRWTNGVDSARVTKKAKREFEKKQAALKAMADPARNSNAHERRVAEAQLAKLQAAGPKAPRMRSAPGLEEYDREQARRQAQADRGMAKMRDTFKAAAAPGRKNRPMRTPAIGPVNTTTKPQATSKAAPVNTAVKPRSAAKPVNTTAPKPRSADRHLEPNRDRHSPGYMRDYMRRRREEARKAKPGK